MQGIAPVYGRDDETVLLIDSEQTLLDSGTNEDATVLLPAHRSSAALSDSPANDSTVLQQGLPPFEAIRTGNNPLMTAAQDVLAFGMDLESLGQEVSMADLRQQAVRQIKTFEARTQSLGIERNMGLAARYVICTYLDEVVVTSPWGGANEWAQESLLSQFHRETYGGQGFFTILQRACEEPHKNLHLLELLFVILSLGFEGKYRVDPDGQRKLDSLRDMIMAMIYRTRGTLRPGLQVGETTAALAKPVGRRIPWRAIGLGVAACLCVLHITLYLMLSQTSTAVAEQVRGLDGVSLIKAN